MKIKETTNENGIQVSYHKCDTCGVKYTITPAAPEGTGLADNCMTDDCDSYDPDHDIEILFMTDEEIAKSKKVVSMDMLRKRKLMDRW